MAFAALGAGAALAQEGQPYEWQTRFTPPATNIMAQVIWFENFTLWFIIPITALVLVLLAWCIWRYRESANPIPSRTSHNTLVEVIWTLGPVLVLIAIAIPSFQLLTLQYTPPREPELTVKVIGNQWNWDYEYQTEAPVSFNSAILNDDSGRAALGKGDLSAYPRLLAVDNELVLPVNTVIRVLLTSNDVIHNWTVPAFGYRHDAVPGRITELWFEPFKEGLFYGQCSELCGKDHAYMPVGIRVVTQDQYNRWLAAAGTDLSGANRALMAEIEAAAQVAAAD
ncbi:MAG TPA: cytochrome c oxidase subunit II [Mesorhizobium sp.]|nr:cytochrome c oxidase subunit II [Mesorhizobium sp.]